MCTKPPGSHVSVFMFVGSQMVVYVYANGSALTGMAWVRKCGCWPGVPCCGVRVCRRFSGYRR
eukprot:10992293-Lingulodinium_polyedra.AAC.1